MLRITKLTDYGTVVMVHVAHHPQRLLAAAEIAAAVSIAPPTVAKILKTLTRAGLLVSQRGVQGGYRLSRPPEAITVAQVIAALEGPVAVTECSEGAGGCTLEDSCAVVGAWQTINRAIHQTLESIDLAQMVHATTTPLPDPTRSSLGPVFK